jgi:hypothetical protein
MSPNASAITTVVVLGFTIFGGYLLALWRHPERNCPTCKGAGRHVGSIWRGRRQCTRCGGRGRLPKLGTQVWEKWMNGSPSRFRTPP